VRLIRPEIARLAAEAADRGVDDRWVAGRDRVVVQTEAGQAAGLEVLDQDVGPTGQLPRGGQVVGVLEVERHGPLVAVDAEVVGRHAVPHGRLPGAGVVTGRSLHLDDLGTEVRQQHGGVRAGEDAGEVGDEQAGQRPTAGGGSRDLSWGAHGSRWLLREWGQRTPVRQQCSQSSTPPGALSRRRRGEERRA
jgi:hypothetical protein